MVKHLEYSHFYKEISVIAKNLLDNEKGITLDLFTSTTDNEHLKFLQPKHISQYIRPVTLETNPTVTINSITKVPDRIHYHIADSNFGKLFIASTDKGICFLNFATHTSYSELRDTFPKALIINQKTNYHTLTLDYLHEKKINRLPLHVKATDFQLQVWNTLCQIPKGQVTTYKHIACAIKKPQASIAVGASVGKNPIALLIPCHRVIRSNGVWQGFRWGNSIKASLLRFELQ